MEDNKVQVLLYTSYLHIIGGIETFVLNYIELLSPYYSIGLMCPSIPEYTKAKIMEKAKYFTAKEAVTCDTLIMIRMMDPIPLTVSYKKSIRMCHACKTVPSWYIRPDCDSIVHVSKASKESFLSDGKVIHNPLIQSEKKSLLFVSATRIPAMDKGKNAERMLKLAKMLNDVHIPFLWLNFSDAPLNNAPKGFVNVGSFQEIQPYIKKADYLVQLSDQEGFGYSVLEALINEVAVICTPFETTKELGVVDGKNGYIIPYDLNFDVMKLLNVPKFSYKYDNNDIVKKWRSILDKQPPRKRKTSSKENLVKVKVVVNYFDTVLNANLKVGTLLYMERNRAEYVKSFGYLRIVEEE